MSMVRGVVLGLLLVSCNGAAEKVSENAICVVDRYREYTEAIVCTRKTRGNYRKVTR